MTQIDNPAPRHETEAFLEGYFRHNIAKLLRGRVVKMVPVEKGMPDRLVMLPGGFLELVELKTVDGTRSVTQRIWHDRARVGQGINVVVLYGRKQIDDYISARIRRAA
jgi:hypothetical protein